MPMNWEDVAKAVTTRRRVLGLTQHEAAARANVSPTTWQKLETRAEPLADRSLDKVAMALGWLPDFAERITAGTPPVLVVDELDGIQLAIEEAEARLEEGDPEAQQVLPALQLQKGRLMGMLGRQLQADPSSSDPYSEVAKGAWRTLTRNGRDLDVVVETPDGAFIVAQATSGDRFLDAIRLTMLEAVAELSFNTLYAAMVAISWARYRDAAVAGLERDERLRMQALAPSLDVLIWNPPSIEEIDRIVKAQWAEARRRFDDAGGQAGV